MLSTKEKGILYYIIRHCKRVEEKTEGITREEFDQNEDIKDVVCFNILQIGELVKKLEVDFLFKYSKVPWGSIKGMRDIVVHGYNSIDWDEIWKAVSQEVKPLREYCEKILNENK